MKKFIKFIIIALLIGLGIFAFTNLTNNSNNPEPEVIETVDVIDENGQFTSKEDVALYIHTYGKLPSNYITKSEAKKIGWKASKGNLQKLCAGCSICGDQFTNREGHLPSKDGRVYYECDIDYQGGRRNGLRIVYSNDGLIYYTQDHYNTFELLYGEP